MAWTYFANDSLTSEPLDCLLLSATELGVTRAGFSDSL
jgi:hypothetical protein